MTLRCLLPALWGPLLALPALASTGACTVLGADDFQHGLAAWRIEAQQPAQTEVSAEGGVLRWATPAGLSLWWRRPLRSPWRVRFTATALPAPPSAGAQAGRVSDLNLFWHATEPDGREPTPRSGAFASYDSLQLDYLGFGANSNRSTRLRHYPGDGRRLIVDGWADPPDAEAADRQGPMTPATRLQAGEPLAVELQSAAGRTQVRVRSVLLFDQPTPLQQGWFALRSTASRFEIRDFHIETCTP